MVNALTKIGKYLDREMVAVLQRNTTARQLVPLNAPLSGKGIGMTSIDTFNMVATGGASTDYKINENQEDKIDVTVDTLKIPVQQQEITVDSRTWASMVSNGPEIETDIVAEMTANISKEQDTNIIMGWKPDGTAYEMDGLYQAAGNTYAGSTFGTYGNAIKTVTNAKKLLRADNVYSQAYNLTLHGDQLAELEGSHDTGISEMKQVLSILNNGVDGGPGRVIESNDLTAGTGMITPIASQENKRYFDLVEAQAPRNSLWITGDPDSSPTHIRQVASLVVRFKHLDSSDNDVCVCTATGI